MDNNTITFITGDGVQFQAPKEIIPMFKYISDRLDRNFLTFNYRNDIKYNKFTKCKLK
jgi:hypothetical protein